MCNEIKPGLLLLKTSEHLEFDVCEEKKKLIIFSFFIFILASNPAHILEDAIFF
jgi:hypothetical protein